MPLFFLTRCADGTTGRVFDAQVKHKGTHYQGIDALDYYLITMLHTPPLTLNCAFLRAGGGKLGLQGESPDRAHQFHCAGFGRPVC